MAIAEQSEPHLMVLYKRLTECYNCLLDSTSTMNNVTNRLVGESPEVGNDAAQVTESVPYGGQFAEVESAVRNIEAAVSAIENVTRRINRLG